MTDVFRDPRFRGSIYKFNNAVLDAAKIFTSETGRELANAELQSDSKGGLTVKLRYETAPSGPTMSDQSSPEPTTPASPNEIFRSGCVFKIEDGAPGFYKYCSIPQLTPFLAKYHEGEQIFKFEATIAEVREDSFAINSFERNMPGKIYIPFSTLTVTELYK